MVYFLKFLFYKWPKSANGDNQVLEILLDAQRHTAYQNNCNFRSISPPRISAVSEATLTYPSLPQTSLYTAQPAPPPPPPLTTSPFAAAVAASQQHSALLSRKMALENPFLASLNPLLNPLANTYLHNPFLGLQQKHQQQQLANSLQAKGNSTVVEKLYIMRLIP